jgi:3-oxoadipate enol-lactonase
VPHAKAGDIQLYYEIHGSGDQTLTLIRGLGADLCAWFAQVPELSKHFRVLVFDNRGAGRSDKPDTPYSIEQMASDVKALLDALGIERTALLGISMGGMIAQEFAIHYPERLSCLILGCTSFGGPRSIALLEGMFKAILAGPVADEAVRELQERALYSDDTIRNNRGLIAAHAEARKRFPMPSFALITGNEDRLIPPANSSLLAEQISGAILKEFPGGHLFTSEHPDVFNSCVIDFVKAHP